jgi:hypothetical protein
VGEPAVGAQDLGRAPLAASGSAVSCHKRSRSYSRELTLRKEVCQLERGLADKVVEVDFFPRCLAKSRGSTPAEMKLWREGIYDQIREMMSMQGSLRIERMCQLAQVSRAGFYRHDLTAGLICRTVTWCRRFRNVMAAP